ncbi:MAG: hypothetical protein FWH18_08705 [Marinilabiliaceae bacterium]|nr:hypothetical protein [Marinilabiliaceae bacterium]
MKRVSILLLGLVLLLALGFAGCNSKKKTKKAEIGTILDDMPCEKDGKSDKNYFRAYSMSESTNLQLSKEKALIAAKQRLITLINSNTKSVTDRYVNEREVGNASEFEQKFENLTREVADETISNVVIICEKTSVLDNKKSKQSKQYRTFISIQVSKDDVLSSMNNRISKDAKLQLDYDKKKFEEIFNQEMEKMAAERGY